MKGRTTQKRTWAVCCTGIVVTVFWATLLFWMRSIPQMRVQRLFPASAHVRLSGFYSDEPNNSGQPSFESSHLDGGLNIQQTNKKWGFLDSYEGTPSKNVIAKTWRYEGSNRTAERVQLSFDRQRSVWTQVHVTQDKDKNRSWTRADTWYAGPKGMSRQYASDLGRFQHHRSVCYYPATKKGLIIFYDGKLRQLFRLDFETQTVTAGTILPREDRVVQMGPTLQKNSKLFLYDESRRHVAAPGVSFTLGAAIETHLVLTSAGEIYEMDVQTVQLKTVIDRLPKFGSGSTIDDLLAYKILPVQINSRFAGIVVAAASRDTEKFHLRATPLGKETNVATNDTIYRGNRFLLSPFLMVRAAEGLHPLSLSLLSRWLAPGVEALAGYRALFILPNSGAVQAYVDPRKDAFAKELGFVIGIVPQLILGLVIGGWLRREARHRGLKSSVCEGWLLAGFIFGVPAYITYQLTRSRLPLITCNNCGKARRADQEQCHHCKSAWESPSVQTPAWRVLESV